jgi:hypothetical protein
MAAKRMEITYDNAHPAWAELEAVASQRGDKRQAVLMLIVQEWYLLKHGLPLTADQLWGLSQGPYAGAQAGGAAQNGTGAADADAPHAGASYLADSLM